MKKRVDMNGLISPQILIIVLITTILVFLVRTRVIFAAYQMIVTPTFFHQQALFT